MNTIKDKITIFHWCFQPNLISRKKWLKKSLYNFICFINNYDFYDITLWMYYTFLIIVFKRHQELIEFYMYQLVLDILLYLLSMVSFYEYIPQFQFILQFLKRFISITITFIINIILAPKTTYQFLIIFFFIS